MKLKSLSVSEALDFLSRDFSSFSFHPQKLKEEKITKKIDVTEERIIKHPALINYIISRKIPVKIAQQFCKEVSYTFDGKSYFSIGLKNKSGGWELRNKIFKNSSSPKDYSLIKNQSSVLTIVEGMFDLLSLITLNPEYTKSRDLLILNSIQFIESAKSIFTNYEIVELHLDRDKAGFNVTSKYISEGKNIVDMSINYDGFKDWNDYLVTI